MLRDIQFSDIYLGSKAAWLAGVPETKDPVRAGDENEEELSALRKLCDEYIKENKKNEFPIRHNDISYRVAVLQSLTELVYVLRRTAEYVPTFGDLGLHPKYVERLLTPDLAGLIVVAGTFGQGKTTTASALVAARLEKFGGVAITIEDPPELPLEGVRGDGVCYQTWAEQGEFGAACRQTARWAPSIIFLGEVRDSETAAEALRASINGRLVVITTHADSVAMAIERLASLANGAVGTTEDCASLLSNGLTAVIHQQCLHNEKRLMAKMLWIHGPEAVGIRNTIKSKRFGQLEQDVQQQLNAMVIGGK